MWMEFWFAYLDFSFQEKFPLPPFLAFSVTSSCQCHMARVVANMKNLRNIDFTAVIYCLLKFSTFAVLTSGL